MDRKEELKYEIESAEEAIKYFENKVENNKKVKKRLEAELEKEEQEENQEWVPSFGETYFYIDLDSMLIFDKCWCDNDIDNTRLKHKVIFKTQEEAEEYLEHLKAKEKAMNEFSKEEWENEKIYKYYINYDCELKKFYTNYEWDVRRINSIFFRTKELAQDFINKYERFLRKELGV